MRMQVVLPQPDGPTIATNSRSLTSKSMSFSATKCLPPWLKVRCTASNRMMAKRVSCGWSVGLEAAPRFDQLLNAPQRDVDQQPDHADRDHSAHHGRGRHGGLALDHQVADAARRDDQFGADQRLPAEPGRDAKAGDD